MRARVWPLLAAVLMLCGWPALAADIAPPGGLTAAQATKLSALVVPATAYLGAVANHSNLPLATAASNTLANTRSVHIAEDKLSGPQLLLPGWYADSSGEHSAAQAITYTASIEYPLGTFTRITFGGAVAGTVQPGGTLLSDAAPATLTVPKGARFWVRLFMQAPGGIIFTNVSGGNIIDGYEFGTSLTDKTMGGTVAASNKSYYLVPLAILGMTRQPSICLVGDSRFQGRNDITTEGNGDVGEGARAVGKMAGYINMGVPSDVAGATSFAHRAALGAYCTHVIVNYGINNLGGSQTDVQTLAALQVTYAYFAGKLIFQTTLPPVTTSSDSWKTVANQTKSTWDSYRVSVNTAIRAGTANVVGVFDTAAAVETGTGDTTQSVLNGGFWKADGTADGAYTTDGIHETPLAALAEIPQIGPNRLSR